MNKQAVILIAFILVALLYMNSKKSADEAETKELEYKEDPKAATAGRGSGKPGTGRTNPKAATAGRG